MPVESRGPPEPEALPSFGNNSIEGIRGYLVDGDDTHGDGGDGEDPVLYHLGDDHAEHSSLDHIKGGDGHQYEGIEVNVDLGVCQDVLRVVDNGWQEGCNELADALEAVGEKPDDADDGKDHHNDMREVRGAAVAKAGLYPLGSRHDVGASQPG